jgi:hypothetical protein
VCVRSGRRKTWYAAGKPDEVVCRALYPVVGEKTLKDLLAEEKANEKVSKAKVRTTLRSSYSSYYRQMLPSIRLYRPDDTPPGLPALGGSLSAARSAWN